MHIHPLVRFIFFLAFSFSVLLADTLTLWAIYFGIFVIIIVALQLIIGGLVNMEVLTIKEQYEFLFSI